MKTAPPTNRSQIIGFSVLTASLTAGYGVLFTLVGDYRDLYGISETTIGWIIGGGFIVEFLALILIAPIGDRGHARSILWAGVSLNIVGLLVMGLGGTALTLMVGRLIAGLATGAAQPVIRRIVILQAPDDVGRNLGILMSAAIFGFAIGPAISAILAEPFGLAAPFVVVAAIGAIAMLVVAFTIDVPEEAADTPTQPRLAVDLLVHRALIGALCYGAAAYAMIGSFDVLWDVVHEDLNTPTWLANIGISLFALPLIVLAPIGGRLAQSIGPFRIGGLGMLVAAGFMTSYGLLATGTSIVVVSLFHALADGFTIASTGVAVAITAPADRQAGAQGLLGAAQALTAGLIAPLTGSVYQHQGRFPAYAMTSLIMVVLVAVGVVMAWPVIRNPGRGAIGAPN